MSPVVWLPTIMFSSSFPPSQPPTRTLTMLATALLCHLVLHNDSADVSVTELLIERQ